MIARDTLVAEPSLALSPIRLRPRDTFLQGPPQGPVTVTVDRIDGPRPTRLRPRWHLTAAGELGFAGLGHSSQSGRPMRLRIAVAAPGLLLDVGGESAIELDLVTWNADEPPAAVIERDLEFHPGPDYRFGAGVPLVSGVVVDPAGTPAALASVSNRTVVRGVPRIEAVRTDRDGRFRLPLRWSTGATTIRSAHPSGAGAVVIDVPADLASTIRVDLT